MNAPVRIRRAIAEDAEVLQALCAEHADYECADRPIRAQRDALMRALSGAPPRLFAWVAECDGSVEGYASASFEFSTWDCGEYLHLDCVFLREKVRRRGLGKALIEAVRAFASEQGCAQLQWQTPHWNVGAARFYRRIGGRSSQKLRFLLDIDPVCGR
jgi:GNAT superfamily N-acetyltransferase